MQFSPISFGSQIPISKCKVYDLSRQMPADAVYYEFDCRDLSDILEIEKLDSTWDFREVTMKLMNQRYIHQFIRESNDGYKFYCLKDPSNKIIGLCTTKDTPDSIEVKFLNSKKNSNYKYAAMNMLAAVAQRVLETNKERMVVKQALPDVCKFYEDVCGFHVSRDTFFGKDYAIPKEEIPEFLNLVQRKSLNIIV